MSNPKDGERGKGGGKGIDDDGCERNVVSLKTKKNMRKRK